MPGSATLAIIRVVSELAPLEVVASTALFALDGDLRIVCWNDGAEYLTGIPADDAVGHLCWEVIAGHDDRGDLVCHKGCSRARIMREGKCVHTTELHARTSDGVRRISFETIAVRNEDGPLLVHVMRDAPDQAPAPEPRAMPVGPAPHLTPQQREILGLLAEGVPAKTIAGSLGLTVATVRNHVRLLFVALGAHSQLEAVARARAYQLV